MSVRVAIGTHHDIEQLFSTLVSGDFEGNKLGGFRTEWRRCPAGYEPFHAPVPHEKARVFSAPSTFRLDDGCLLATM